MRLSDRNASAYGTVVSDWKQTEHKFTVTMPANTTATVTLLGEKAETTRGGTHTYTVK